MVTTSTQVNGKTGLKMVMECGRISMAISTLDSGSMVRSKGLASILLETGRSTKGSLRIFSNRERENNLLQMATNMKETSLKENPQVMEYTNFTAPRLYTRAISKKDSDMVKESSEYQTILSIMGSLIWTV